MRCDVTLCRLTPAYLMMIGVTATWMYRLRDGPLWERFVGDYKDLCRQYYWSNIAYLNNYIFSDDGYVRKRLHSKNFILVNIIER